MKRTFAFLAIMVLCLSCLTYTASAEESLWTDGTLDIHGHTVDVHAIIQDTMPTELQQIKLKGRLIKKDVFHQTLQKYFTLHPDFSLKNYQPVDDFFFSEWATDYSAVSGYTSDLLVFREVERLFPIEDPTLRSLYDQCLAVLADLGITATKNVGYISHYERRGVDYIMALIPYQIEELSTEYDNQLVSRDSLQYSSKTGMHIMDYPWADFVFDNDLQLVHVQMASFQVASAKELSGSSISWEQAAVNVLEAVIDTRIDTKKTLEHQPDYDEEQFWADYRVQLVRALPMWMPNWSNVCVPGWCIQYQLYDSATGDFVYAPSYCAEALTGKVAYYPRGN